MSVNQNQQNPLLRKKGRVDNKGNTFKRWGVYTRLADRKSKVTFPIVTGLTPNEIKVLESKIRDFVSKTERGKIVCDFINF